MNGFIRIFCLKAWQIIKKDITVTLLNLFVGDGRGFASFNKALTCLILKKAFGERWAIINLLVSHIDYKAICDSEESLVSEDGGDYLC